MTDACPLELPDELERALTDAVVDGRIDEGDADAVRTFASFLAAAGPGPNAPGFSAKRFRGAYRLHYPADYKRALAVHRRRLAEAAAAEEPAQ